MLIPCPWCGEREETEFHYGGQAHDAYPDDPSAVDDAAWAAYLFVRDNPKGWFAERWLHRAGCQRWFNALRHTVTYEIAGSSPPVLPGRFCRERRSRRATAKPGSTVEPLTAGLSVSGAGPGCEGVVG